MQDLNIRVLYVEALFVKPVDKFVGPWGLAGMGEGPVYRVCIEIAQEERGNRLVEFRGEDVGDGVVTGLIARDLMVDIDETEGLIANYNVEHH